MFDQSNEDRERGQVGIGTLIVFIALVLVAAIAAGVLINTAGFLQNQAESTGQESSDQVTQSLQSQGVIGTANGSGAIDVIEVQVAKAPGADAINVNKSTIQFVSPSGAATLTSHASVGSQAGDTAGIGEAAFEVDNEVLEEDSETATITIYLLVEESSPADPAMANLAPGEEVTMEITTASGGTTTVVATVPEPLTTDSDGDQVRL